jgi:hypothetical protein
VTNRRTRKHTHLREEVVRVRMPAAAAAAAALDLVEVLASVVLALLARVREHGVGLADLLRTPPTSPSRDSNRTTLALNLSSAATRLAASALSGWQVSASRRYAFLISSAT